jgi:hypothetical protein
MLVEMRASIRLRARLVHRRSNAPHADITSSAQPRVSSGPFNRSGMKTSTTCAVAKGVTRPSTDTASVAAASVTKSARAAATQMPINSRATIGRFGSASVARYAVRENSAARPAIIRAGATPRMCTQ